MRVHVPAEKAAAPQAYVARTYAAEIVAAAKVFSQTTYERTKLSLREFEGARARTAEINGCQLCQSWRSSRDVPAFLQAVGSVSEQSVADHGPAPDEDFYVTVSEWRTAPCYSPRERVAIEYAERMGLDPQGLATDDEFWGRAKALFADDEIVDLSYCVAAWMGLGRVAHVLGLDDVCAIPTRPRENEAA
ncbi:carboxymuconolactone decarboxylase family protein [soil metagenome]